ncbi:hypothetical protein LCGC14_1249470 [marine sediment metagenome]|uniref:Bro-N domain-containing protein n=1 Tax=marine sediment metagenome TaxID=412755 RepID=A0A0F9P7G4_9ZZZZ
MTAELTLFNYRSDEVRVIIDDKGSPWWVAMDICKALGYKPDKTHEVISKLDDDDREKIAVADKLGRNQDTYIINEPGLYTLILRSNKQEAINFKKWITHDVLPEIRKTGAYITNKLSRLDIARMLVEAEEERIVLEQENQKLLPKAEKYDDFINSDGLYNLQSLGKILGYSPNLYLNILREMGILYKRGGINLPYQPYEDKGYFVVKAKTSPYNNMSIKQTFATPEGLGWLNQLDIKL